MLLTPSRRPLEAAELLGRHAPVDGWAAACLPNAAASANIVGKLEVGKDGGETVLQRRKRPSAHVHFRAEAITEFAFTFVDPGFGAQPCLELRTREGAAVLRLYYQGKKAARRFEEFAERTGAHSEFVKGTWLAPAAAENEGIFVEESGPKTDDGPAGVVDDGGAAEVEASDAEVDESAAHVDESSAQVDGSNADGRRASSHGGDGAREQEESASVVAASGQRGGESDATEVVNPS